MLLACIFLYSFRRTCDSTVSNTEMKILLLPWTSVLSNYWKQQPTMDKEKANVDCAETMFIAQESHYCTWSLARVDSLGLVEVGVELMTYNREEATVLLWVLYKSVILIKGYSRSIDIKFLVHLKGKTVVEIILTDLAPTKLLYWAKSHLPFCCLYSLADIGNMDISNLYDITIGWLHKY